MLSVLGQRSYRYLFAAQVLSLLGTGLTTVALALLAFQIAGTEAGVVLGTALALKMVVYVGLSPVAEVIARNLPRKSFLVALDIARAGFVLLLPFVSEVWHIYALVILFQACSAAFTPVFQATIPDLLSEEEDYTKALSLSRLAYDLEALASPMLAGALLSILSFHWLFVGTTLGFLASAFLVSGATVPQRRPSDTGVPFRDRLTRGAWIYLATPRLRGLLALSFAVAAAGSMVIVNTVVLVQGSFGGTEKQVALLFASYGAGSMMVALALPQVLHVLSERAVMLTGAFTLSAVLALFPLVTSLTTAAVVWCAMGAAAALVQTPAGLLLRRSAHPEDRPAVFAAQFALSHACWLLAYPLAGWGGATLGLPATALVLAAGAAVATGLAVRLWPNGDPVIIEHDHSALEHAHGHGDPVHHHSTDTEIAQNGWHKHPPVRHAHPFVVDDHHPVWPRS